MTDFCPPVIEWHYFVNPDPYLRYVNFTLGLLLAVPLAFLMRWR